jgi:hypothetical protein
VNDSACALFPCSVVLRQQVYFDRDQKVATIDCLATSGIEDTSWSNKKLCVCPCNKINILQFMWLVFCKTTILSLAEVSKYVQFIPV